MIVLKTKRLLIRKARPDPDDVDFYFKLWTCPEVMRNVGFPQGLRITPDRILASISGQSVSEFNNLLVIELIEGGDSIGECKLGWPDKEGLAETDVKLLPPYWGKGYGREVKQALVNYLFTHTSCRGVKATPNKTNIASIKMQEAVGARRVGEFLYQFPEAMKDYTTDVDAYVYILFRDDWSEDHTSNHADHSFVHP